MPDIPSDPSVDRFQETQSATTPPQKAGDAASPADNATSKIRGGWQKTNATMKEVASQLKMGAHRAIEWIKGPPPKQQGEGGPKLGGHRRADTIAQQSLSGSQQAVKPPSEEASNDKLEDIITGGESDSTPPSDDETSSTQDLNQPIKPKTRHKPQAPAGQIGGHRGETGSRDKAQIGTRNQATPPKTAGSTPLTSGTVLKGGQARKPPNKTGDSPNKADSNKNPMRLEGSGKDIYEIMEDEAKQSEAGRKSAPSKENIHHNTDRATSNGILGAEPKGSFLIRDSSLEGRIAISYNVDHGTTTHRLLEPQENNEYSVNLGDENQGKIIKGTIPDIINQLGGDEKHVKPSAEQRSAPAPKEGNAGSQERIGPDASSRKNADIWRLPEENEQASGAENKGETTKAPSNAPPPPPPRPQTNSRGALKDALDPKAFLKKRNKLKNAGDRVLPPKPTKQEKETQDMGDMLKKGLGRMNVDNSASRIDDDIETDNDDWDAADADYENQLKEEALKKQEEQETQQSNPESTIDSTENDKPQNAPESSDKTEGETQDVNFAELMAKRRRKMGENDSQS